MKFIEALKLKSKLFFLFLLITLALLSIGMLGSSYINAMKKNIDALYFGSLVPVTRLNSIVQTYNTQLASTLYKASLGSMSSSETLVVLQEGLHHINTLWLKYKQQYKTKEELEYVDYTAMEIARTNHYFQKIIEAIEGGQNLRKLSMQTLEKQIENITTVLAKLIKYEVDVAHYERKRFLRHYHNTLFEMGSILLVIILSIIGITLYVFKGIQKDHNRLESLAKKLKRLNKKLENASYTDSLTNLHNRRYFNMVYEREIRRAKRSKTFITFMMLDIDYFKQYNDTYGHLKGDEALKQVAKTLRNKLKRPSDYIFRLGGEEFGVLLSETDEDNSARLAHALCEAIKACKIEHESSLVGEYLSISVGVACCVADSVLDENMLISQADAMLYKAKENGRNRYELSSNLFEEQTLAQAV